MLTAILARREREKHIKHYYYFATWVSEIARARANKESALIISTVNYTPEQISSSVAYASSTRTHARIQEFHRKKGLEIRAHGTWLLILTMKGDVARISPNASLSYYTHIQELVRARAPSRSPKPV